VASQDAIVHAESAPMQSEHGSENPACTKHAVKQLV